MTEELKQYTFTVAQAGERLDKLIVAHLPDLSRVQIQTLIKDGLVTVNGQLVKAGIKLKGGETVAVTFPEPKQTTMQAEPIKLNVLYEDEYLAVINKPAGMVVHPGTGVDSGTLVNALLARYPELANMQIADRRQGIVHRLDRETSGVLVVARTEKVMRDLMKQFQERTVEKAYTAMLERVPKTLHGRITAPIGRDPQNRQRMAVQKDGRPAITEFKVLDDNFREGQALVEIDIHTGRTHQIRVHMAFIGCPIVGDVVYGFRKQRIGLKRHFLHAHKLTFTHPITGERMTFESPLPVALVDAMQKLR